MGRAWRHRMANPTPWWAMSAVALLAAALDIATRAPVEIAGILIVAAALGVLGAAVCTRRRRLALWGWPERGATADCRAALSILVRDLEHHDA